MNKESIEQKFKELEAKYNNLIVHLEANINQLLKDNLIDISELTPRIKSLNSFIEKIERKKYQNPFDDIEDICGLRIVCYYPSDIEKISTIIKNEFNIIKDDNKTAELENDKFGYRSYHFIATIKKEWEYTPAFKGLSDYKFEIQVRTILMHAWASINHKLQYKHEDDIAPKLKRDLFRLSALVEMADEQFDKVRQEKNDYILTLIDSSKEEKTFDTNVDLNLDSLQAFLDFYFPDRHNGYADELLVELKKFNIDLKLLDYYVQKCAPFVDLLEKEVYDKLNLSGNWAQVGIMRTICDLMNNDYRFGRYCERDPDNSEIEEIENKYIKMIQSSLNR